LTGEKGIAMEFIKNNLLYGKGLHVRNSDASIMNDSEEKLFATLLEMSIYHTNNITEVYDRLAEKAQNRSHKLLFVQLGCRKKEVMFKLNRQRTSLSILHAPKKTNNDTFIANCLDEVNRSPFVTIDDALTFAMQRENSTLSLYEKMNKILNHSSVKTLFAFLIESQYKCLDFLSSQEASVTIAAYSD
jgi:hypothetical protein